MAAVGAPATDAADATAAAAADANADADADADADIDADPAAPLDACRSSGSIGCVKGSPEGRFSVQLKRSTSRL